MCAAPCIADTALEGSITNHSTKLTLLFVSDLHQDHKSVTDSQSQESFKIASIFTAKNQFAIFVTLPALLSAVCCKRLVSLATY